MKKPSLLHIAAALVAALGITLAGCGDDKAAAGGSVASEPKAEVITLKLGHIQSEQDLWQTGSLKFKEEVEKLSNGTMVVNIFPNSTLGGDRDLAEGMKMGTVDFGLIAGVLGNFDKSISILELPTSLETTMSTPRSSTAPSVRRSQTTCSRAQASAS